MRRIWAALAIVSLSLACGSTETPTAPTAQSIGLRAESVSVALNASVPVTADVRTSRGTSIDGVVVHFVSTFGALSAWDVPTRNGIATTTLAAGSVPGTAVITAAVGSDAAVPLQITIGGGAVASSLLLQPEEALLPSTGGSLNFGVTAFSGDGLTGGRVEGVLVSFSTTSGSLSVPSATSDSLGRAVSRLTTTTTATVTARVAGATSASLVRSATVTIAPSPSASLSVAVTIARVGEAITATVRNTGPLPGGRFPQLAFTWGDGGVTNGCVCGAVTLSHGYASPGEYLLTGRASSATFPVETVATDPVRVTIGAQVRVGLVYDHPNTIAGGQSHTFTLFPHRASNPIAVRVDFGDGTSQPIDPAQVWWSVVHLYSRPGTYTARAIQTNADGTTETATVDIFAAL